MCKVQSWNECTHISVSGWGGFSVGPNSYLECIKCPVFPSSLHSCRAWLKTEPLNRFFFCPQLLHMTVDISFCCQNVINKTWGVERATISPFNHYSICNENFIQCVIFSECLTLEMSVAAFCMVIEGLIVSCSLHKSSAYQKQIEECMQMCSDDLLPFQG